MKVKQKHVFINEVSSPSPPSIIPIAQYFLPLVLVHSDKAASSLLVLARVLA